MDSETVAVVLAGGYATRFWPITKNKPKVLLPVDGEKCVMDKQIQEATEDERVSEVYVSTNTKFEDQISEHINKASYKTPQVSVEQTENEEEKLGVIGALRQFVRRENLDNTNLLVVAGDNIMDMNLSELIDEYERKETTYIVTYDIEDREKASSYGVVGVGEDRNVEKFEEKPDHPSSSLVSTACYMISSEDVMFDKYLENDNNPDEPGRYMDWLKDRTNMKTYSFTGKWFDIGTPEGYLDAVEWWLDGDNYVSDSAELSDCRIGSNTIVLDNCEIEDARIKSSVVFPNSKLVDSYISRSVIDEGVLAESTELTDGILGNRYT